MKLRTELSTPRPARQPCKDGRIKMHYPRRSSPNAPYRFVRLKAKPAKSEHVDGA